LHSHIFELVSNKVSERVEKRAGHPSDPQKLDRSALKIWPPNLLPSDPTAPQSCLTVLHCPLTHDVRGQVRLLKARDTRFHLSTKYLFTNPLGLGLQWSNVTPQTHVEGRHSRFRSQATSDPRHDCEKLQGSALVVLETTIINQVGDGWQSEREHVKATRAASECDLGLGSWTTLRSIGGDGNSPSIGAWKPRQNCCGYTRQEVS
jgi:hypothetical protein